MFFYEIAKKIRHAKFWEKRSWLWGILRAIYYFLVRLCGDRIKIRLPGNVFVSVPPAIASWGWQEYEKEPISKAVAWFRGHPGSFFIDIGCNKGIYSIAALFAQPSVQVYAVDSDVKNLSITKEACRFADRNRLHLLRGFISDTHPTAASLDSALEETRREIFKLGPKADLYHEKQLNLQDKNRDPGIPIYRIDGLFCCAGFRGRPGLIKCDVEGAEFLVLRGAGRFLEEVSPALLVSIHDYFYEKYFGHTLADVRDFLNSKGYHIASICRDVEEHWWCEKQGI